MIRGLWAKAWAKLRSDAGTDAHATTPELGRSTRFEHFFLSAAL
jgi:hypothetical protein